MDSGSLKQIEDSFGPMRVVVILSRYDLIICVQSTHMKQKIIPIFYYKILDTLAIKYFYFMINMCSMFKDGNGWLEWILLGIGQNTRFQSIFF